MRVFRVGTTNVRKMTVTWIVVFGYAFVMVFLLTLIFGSESLSQCSSDYTGEITVKNCTEYESFSVILSLPMTLISIPALVYSVLAFFEYKRKKTLTAVMGSHGAENYVSLERLLKILNRQHDSKLLNELQERLQIICSSLKNYLTDDGLTNYVQETDFLTLESLNEIYNSLAATFEPAASAYDAEVRAQKLEYKKSKEEAVAAKALERSMVGAQRQIMSDSNTPKKQRSLGKSLFGLGRGFVNWNRRVVAEGRKPVSYRCSKCKQIKTFSTPGTKKCCGRVMVRI